MEQMKQWVVVAGLALMLGLLGACRAGSSLKVYSTRGVIQEIEPDLQTVRIKHEEIPGYMAAMTMPFSVKRTNDLVGFKPGDVVTFEMVVTSEAGWIRRLVHQGETTVDALPSAREGFRRVREVEPLAVGDAMPDYSFTNELGRRINFASYRGRALALTFIFTRCPFPDFCPRVTRNFGETIKELGERSGGKTNFHFFSITFDPEYDTPERLKKHALMQRYPSKRWSFLTGAQIDIDAITEQFGLGFAYRAGTFDHTLRTVVIDANGVIRQIYIGNTWKSEELAAAMIKASQL